MTQENDGELRLLLDYVTGRDIFTEIKKAEEKARDSNRTLLGKIGDYAAYGIAVGQRFLTHALAVAGLERIIEGYNLDNASIFLQGGLMTIPPLIKYFASLCHYQYYRGDYSEGYSRKTSLSNSKPIKPPKLLKYIALRTHHLFNRENLISNAKTVVDYLAGADLVRYIKIHESSTDKIHRRNLIIRLNDYKSYLSSFLLRYTPTIVLIDGILAVTTGNSIILTMGKHLPLTIRKYVPSIFQLNPKDVGLPEIILGLSKYWWDYVHYKKRMRWHKLLNAMNEEPGLIERLLEKPEKSS